MRKLIIIHIIYFLLIIHFAVSTNYLKFEYKNNTGNAITSVDNLGFVCKTLDCDTSNGDPVIGTLWSGNIQTATSNTIVLGFLAKSEAPSNAKSYLFLSSNHEYKTNFKFIPVSQQLTGQGSSPTNPYFNSNGIITFVKVSQCSAPISLSVTNNISENLPISISSGANLDATTKSAIGFSDPVWSTHIPTAAKQYFEAETTLRLRIYKYDASASKNIGSAIEAQNVVKRIYYDDTVTVEFDDWTPEPQEDDFTYYNVSVTSVVTDPKCSSKINQQASKIIRVWKRTPRNECYSLIDADGLVVSPTGNNHPETGEEVSITLKKLSNYANDYDPWDSNFKLAPTDTNITIQVSGPETKSVSQILLKNPDDNFAQAVIKWTPLKSGQYSLNIIADSTNYACPMDTSSDPYIQPVYVYAVPKYDITFLVKAQNTPTTASVTINELPQTKQTDASGTAIFNLDRGTYTYKVEKTSYVTDTGTVTLSQNIDKSINLVSSVCPGKDLMTDVNNCGVQVLPKDIGTMCGQPN